MTIGDSIRMARTEKKMTQAQLAAEMHVSAAMISQYERGERNPKIETINKIAEVLGVPVAQLIPELEVMSGLQAKSAYQLINEPVGQNLQELREMIGLSMEELAVASGLSKATLEGLEAGRADFTAYIIVQLANGLSMAHQELMNQLYKTQDGITDSVKEAARSISETAEGMLETVKEVREQRLILNYHKLNETGQKEAEKRVEELTQIPKYTDKKIGTTEKTE